MLKRVDYLAFDYGFGPYYILKVPDLLEGNVITYWSYQILQVLYDKQNPTNEIKVLKSRVKYVGEKARLTRLARMTCRCQLWREKKGS